MSNFSNKDKGQDRFRIREQIYKNTPEENYNLYQVNPIAREELNKLKSHCDCSQISQKSLLNKS